MLNIVIRTDASIRIGTGHVMRCLTLADQLKQFGGNIYFICRELEGDLVSFIKDKGFKVLTLGNSNRTLKMDPWHWYKLRWASDARETISAIEESALPVSLLIVDHYGLDMKWETEVRKYAAHIMVIDDLANRRHNCDFLLDQNIYEHLKTRYDNLVPDSCIKFLGPDYMLLRNEFFNYKSRIRDGRVANILVSFGGSDPRNETSRVIKILASLQNKFTVNVVVGQSNKFKEEIQLLCIKYGNLHYHYQANNMAQLINDADISIGAGGISMWERCFLGLPSLIISLAENQIQIAKMAQRLGAAIYLGNSKDLSDRQIAEKIDSIFSKPYVISDMSRKASDLFDRNTMESFYTAKKIIGSIK